MNGREFVNVARVAVADPEEEWQRTAAGRTHFALFRECRDALERWRFAATSIHQAHAAVRNRLYAIIHADLKHLGRLLVSLNTLRVHADYDLVAPFISAFQIEQNIDLVEDAIAVLDELESDPAKRAAAIAALQGIP